MAHATYMCGSSAYSLRATPRREPYSLRATPCHHTHMHTHRHMPLLLHDPASDHPRSLHISVITPPHVYTPCFMILPLITHATSSICPSTHPCWPVRPACCSLLFLVAMPPWREYDSSDKGSWQGDSWKDGSSSSSSNAWQSDDGHWMYANEQTAEGWGVSPPSRPQASDQLA